MFLGKTSKQPALHIGIHLDDGSLGVVVLHWHQGRTHWLRDWYWQFDENHATPKDIAERLTDALTGLDLTQAVIISCVATTTVMTQVIDFNGKLNDDDIEAQLILDADKYISQPLDEIAFDFVLLSQDDFSTKILLVVAHRSAIEACQDTLAFANLEPKIIEPQSFAIARAIGQIVPFGEPTMVLNIGKRQSLIGLWQDGKMTVSQVQFVGWADWVDDVADKWTQNPSTQVAKADDMLAHKTDQPNSVVDFWQQDFDDGEIAFGDDFDQIKLIAQVDFWRDEQSSVTQLASQDDSEQTNFWQTDDYAKQDNHAIKQLLATMRLLAVNVAPKQVILCGATKTQLAHLLTAITDESQQNHTDWQVFLASPPSSINPSSEFTAIMTAYGLAMRTDFDGVNLLDWREQNRLNIQQKVKKQLLAVVIGALAVLLLLAGFLWYQNDKQANINGILEQKITEQNEKISQIATIKKQIEQHKQQLGAMNNLDHHNAVWLERWQKFATLAPKGVYLQSVHYGETVSIGGLADETMAVTQFANLLERSGLYASVVLGELQKDTTSGAMRFMMTLEPIDDQNIVPNDVANTVNAPTNTQAGE